MHLYHQHTALYAAFDVYPTAKGASTHIYHFARTLFEHQQGGWLSVLGSPKLPSYQLEEHPLVEITRFPSNLPNFLKRTQAYGNFLFEQLKNQNQLSIAHFRDPWSGLPILEQASRQKITTIYEVNGLPSIELPYRYPQIAPSTLQKIQALEKKCLQTSDYLITPSETIRQYLIQQGISPPKITTIHNGAEIVAEEEIAIPLLRTPYLVYFGALQPWQGLDNLLRAIPYLADFGELKLVICASNREKSARPFRRLAEKLAIQDKIIWEHQLSKRELYAWVKYALLSIAPLRECSRNLEQGCCPLKILESMALATPVVASDMPAVREIISEPSLGKLVRSDRPAELARAIRLYVEYPEFAREMGAKAQNHIREQFLWTQKEQELKAFYEKIAIA